MEKSSDDEELASQLDATLRRRLQEAKAEEAPAQQLREHVRELESRLVAKDAVIAVSQNKMIKLQAQMARQETQARRKLKRLGEKNKKLQRENKEKSESLLKVIGEKDALELKLSQSGEHVSDRKIDLQELLEDQINVIETKLEMALILKMERTEAQDRAAEELACLRTRLSHLRDKLKKVQLEDQRSILETKLEKELIQEMDRNEAQDHSAREIEGLRELILHLRDNLDEESKLEAESKRQMEDQRSILETRLDEVLRQRMERQEAQDRAAEKIKELREMLLHLNDKLDKLEEKFEEQLKVQLNIWCKLEDESEQELKEKINILETKWEKALVLEMDLKEAQDRGADEIELLREQLSQKYLGLDQELQRKSEADQENEQTKLLLRVEALERQLAETQIHECPIESPKSEVTVDELLKENAILKVKVLNLEETNRDLIDRATRIEQWIKDQDLKEHRKLNNLETSHAQTAISYSDSLHPPSTKLNQTL